MVSKRSFGVDFRRHHHEVSTFPIRLKVSQRNAAGGGRFLPHRLASCVFTDTSLFGFALRNHIRFHRRQGGSRHSHPCELGPWDQPQVHNRCNRALPAHHHPPPQLPLTTPT